MIHTALHLAVLPQQYIWEVFPKWKKAFAFFFWLQKKETSIPLHGCMLIYSSQVDGQFGCFQYFRIVNHVIPLLWTKLILLKQGSSIYTRTITQLNKIMSLLSWAGRIAPLLVSLTLRGRPKLSSPTKHVYLHSTWQFQQREHVQ